MALTKSIAGYFKEVTVRIPIIDMQGNFVVDENNQIQYGEHQEKIWIPQQDVALHPLEEEVIMASWARGEIELQVPAPPSQKQEHDWLIEFGADYVIQKREEYDFELSRFEPSRSQAKIKHDQCVETYKTWQENEGKDYHKNLVEGHMLNVVNTRIAQINELVLNRVNELKASMQGGENAA